MESIKLLKEAVLSDNMLLVKQLQSESNMSDDDIVGIIFEAYKDTQGVTPEHLLHSLEEGLEILKEEGYIDADTSGFSGICD